MVIRPFEQKDLPAAVALWNASVSAGEVAYKTIDADYYHKKFEQDPNYDARYAYVADDGEVIGFICGTAKKVLLPNERYETAPGYVTCIFVRADRRRRGVGRALLNRLTEEFIAAGKSRLRCAESNPINLDWIIPGTPGHDHNNAPGVAVDGPGYPFFAACGFTDIVCEVAMYLNLADYAPWGGLAAKQAELAAQGIYTGRYDPAWDLEFDGMCDRVGSDYWRASLGSEIACWKEGHPNSDNRFIPNGVIPSGPRPILVATHENHVVGFTGPVDKQVSGRGWFTGICTDPLYQGRGIASVLFNLLMQEFIAEGAVFSTLFTGASEENPAQRIYKRVGFQPKKEWVLMGKEL